MKWDVQRSRKERYVMQYRDIIKDQKAAPVSFTQKTAYLYLALPIVIFFIFWVKPIYGMPTVMLIFAALTRILCRDGMAKGRKPDKEEYKKLAVCLFLICIWVYFSGIGRFVFQNPDHLYRNAMFRILVDQHWPVIYERLGAYSGRPLALIYYFAFWLPAAVVGKLFTIEAGFTFQAVWAAAGVFLAFCLFCEFRGRVRMRYLAIFVIFSGLDIIGADVMDMGFELFSKDHLEWWGVGLQYSSFTTQLFWVFNQAVPAWLITAMILVQKDRRTLVFIYSFAILSCTFPAVGMLPVLAYQAIVCAYDHALDWKKNILKLIQEICTWENVACGGIIGIVCYLFLRNNSSGQVQEMAGIEITAYLLFLFCEVFFYFLLLFKYCAKCGLYYVSMLSLVLIPFVGVGTGGDFCMRVSMPALLIVYLYVTQMFDQCLEKKDYLMLAALVLVLAVGSITPVHEFTRTIENTQSGNLNHGEAVLYRGKLPNNFFGYADRSFFFKYLVSDR